MPRWARPLFSLILAIIITTWLHWHSHHPAAVMGYGTAQIGGNFTLTDTTGKSVTDSSFRGQPMLVYLGYSGCPDICPMTLGTMHETLNLLGPDAHKVAFVFITLDPKHDKPAVLGKYLAHFDSRIIGLTGSQDAIDKVAQNYKTAFTQTTVPATGKVLISHSGFLFLMDSKGAYVTHFDSDAKAQTVAAAIKKLL